MTGAIIFGVVMFASGMVAGAAIMASRCDEKADAAKRELAKVREDWERLDTLIKREAPWLYVNRHH